MEKQFKGRKTQQLQMLQPGARPRSAGAIRLPSPASPLTIRGGNKGWCLNRGSNSSVPISARPQLPSSQRAASPTRHPAGHPALLSQRLQGDGRGPAS